MAELVRYSLDGSVATIAMDDGKVNALSCAMQAELLAALDQAECDHACVVLTGRPGRFSAGFDLATLRAGGNEATHMVRGGFELSARLLSFPYPVVTASTGHALAMGFFLLLSGDYVVGVDGPYRLAANEVAIGLRVPMPAMAVMRSHMTPAVFTRAALLAETFSPRAALEAGIFDKLVADDELPGAVRALATGFASLDMKAHAATKRLARAATVDAIHEGTAQLVVPGRT